jgi:hypothetical protein
MAIPFRKIQTCFIKDRKQNDKDLSVVFSFHPPLPAKSPQEAIPLTGPEPLCWGLIF